MSVAATPVPEQIRDASVALLSGLCAISSESGNTEGLRRVAALLGSRLERFGLLCEITSEPDAEGRMQPVLIARGSRAGGGEGHLLLVGHMDTVLPAIVPHIEGERMVGTGALDMKGGLAMLVGALELLAASGQAAPGDLVLLAVPDEEVTGEISGRAIRKWSHHARAVLVIEPGEARSHGETLVAGRRGLTEWQLEVTGRPAHSGLAFWSGRSALAAAAEWSHRAQALSRPGSGATVNVGRMVAGTADFVEQLGENHGMLGTSRQRNVIPDRARVEGEARFLRLAEGPAVLAELAAMAEHIASAHGVAAIFSTGLAVPPVDPHGPGAELVRRTVALAAARGFHLEVEEDRGGISFPNYLTDPARIPVVDGLGPVGDGMHTRDEWLSLPSLERRIVLFADLLATL